MAVSRLLELEGLKVVYEVVDLLLEGTTRVSTATATTNLWYDCEDRLTSLTGNGLNDGFSSNAFDTRVQKTDASGVHNYMRDGGGPTDSLLSDGTSTFNPGISQRTSGTTTVNHYNYLGSVTAQTTGLAESNPDYDAFGNSITGPPSGPFGFAGGYGYQTDSDTGLQLLGHRYYDSSIGRFITRDPAQDGMNWYEYGMNNPNSYIDLSGKNPILIAIGVVLLIGWLYEKYKYAHEATHLLPDLREKTKKSWARIYAANDEPASDEDISKIRSNQIENGIHETVPFLRESVNQVYADPAFGVTPTSTAVLSAGQEEDVQFWEIFTDLLNRRLERNRDKEFEKSGHYGFGIKSTIGDYFHH